MVACGDHDRLNARDRRFVFTFVEPEISTANLLHVVTAVSGLAVATAPDVAHYLPFLMPLVINSKWAGGVGSTFAAAVAATLFTFIALAILNRECPFILTVSEVVLITGSSRVDTAHAYCLCIRISIHHVQDAVLHTPCRGRRLDVHDRRHYFLFAGFQLRLWRIAICC